jgi:uncharacterized protein (DUF1501 family)
MIRTHSLPDTTRRGALAGVLGLGVSVRLLGESAFADSNSALARRRLVVIICRGGLDGLSLSPPIGDRAYAGLRGAIALPGFGQPDGALQIDDTFGLHPALPSVHALAVKGQARIAPAIATPDRERSHFEAQDVLESGAVIAYGTSSGWLNRALEAMGPATKVRAMSLGPTAPLVLRGKVEAVSWSPGGARGDDQRLPGILQDLYAHDPLLGPALAGGLLTQSMAGVATSEAASEMGPDAGPNNMMAATTNPQQAKHQNLAQARQLGATLAGFMTQPAGAQVAAVEIDGFDTHANQGAAEGQLANRLAYVDAFLSGLEGALSGRDTLTPDAWRDTVVVMATEFGRTARVNGTGGTDHGTASTALVLGGAIRPGGIIGDWPTLAQNRLFENRDTTPTVDMRGLFKGILRDHLWIDRNKLDTLVFPDSATVAPAEGLVA